MIEEVNNMGKEICRQFFDRMAHADIEDIKKLLVKDIAVKFPFAKTLNSR